MARERPQSGRSAAKVATELGIRPPLLYRSRVDRAARPTRREPETDRGAAWRS